jgi:hypothetical protein
LLIERSSISQRRRANILILVLVINKTCAGDDRDIRLSGTALSSIAAAASAALRDLGSSRRGNAKYEESKKRQMDSQYPHFDPAIPLPTHTKCFWTSETSCRSSIRSRFPSRVYPTKSSRPEPPPSSSPATMIGGTIQDLASRQ